MAQHHHLTLDAKTFDRLVGGPRRTVVLGDEAYARIWWHLFLFNWEAIALRYQQDCQRPPCQFCGRPVLDLAHHQPCIEELTRASREANAAWMAENAQRQARYATEEARRKAERTEANRVAVAKSRAKAALQARYAGVVGDYRVAGLSPTWLEEQPDRLFDDPDYWSELGYPFGSRNATGRPSGSLGHQRAG